MNGRDGNSSRNWVCQITPLDSVLHVHLFCHGLFSLQDVFVNKEYCYFLINEDAIF